jgi:hypothetical protein
MKKWICHKEYSYFNLSLFEDDKLGFKIMSKGEIVIVRSSYSKGMLKGDRGFYKIYTLNDIKNRDKYILVTKKELKKHFLELSVYRKSTIKKLCNS